jgi:hypothetical protein
MALMNGPRKPESIAIVLHENIAPVGSVIEPLQFLAVGNGRRIRGAVERFDLALGAIGIGIVGRIA